MIAEEKFFFDDPSADEAVIDGINLKQLNSMHVDAMNHLIQKRATVNCIENLTESS